MEVKQFRYSTDNLGYLVYFKNIGIAIDTGAVEHTLVFADQNNINIKFVINTHSHHDHTSGNKELLKKTSAEFIDCRKIKSDQTMTLGTQVLKIFHTPGHTEDSIAFMADDFLITGDTLFNGTVGNCFSGDLNAFYLSLKRIISFPEETKIYSGHDYVMESMEMAKKIDKNNPDIEKYIKKYNPELVVSTLEDELLVNPYIRFNAKSMIDNLLKKRLPSDTEFERFQSIMETY